MCSIRNDRKSVVVRAVGCPLLKGGREARAVPWRKGLTVRQASGEAFPGIALSAWASRGIPVDGGALAEPGTEYFAWEVPASSAAAALTVFKVISVVLAVASAAYGAVMAYKSNREAKKLKKALRNSDYSKEVEDVSDTNYGWDYDASNTRGQGAPLPVLYGERLVLPPLVQVHTRRVGSNQEYLELVAAVCQGGAGLADTTGVLSDADGGADIRLNHSSWRNYILEKQFASDDSYETDRLDTNTNVHESVYLDEDTGDLMESYTGSNLSLLFNYGDPDVKPTGLITDVGGAYGRINTPSAEGLTNTGKKKNLSILIQLSYEVRLVEVDLLMKAGEGTSFKVYCGTAADGQNLRGYSFFASSAYTGLTEAGTTKKQKYWTAQNFANETFYKYILITGFKKSSFSDIYKIHAYGSINQATGTDIRQYAEVETRPGSPVQEPLTVCTGVWNTIRVSKNLSVDWFTFATSGGASPEKLELNLEFPYGIYDASGTSMQPYTVTVEIQRRWVDADGTAGAWKDFAGASGGYFSISAQSSSAYGVTYAETLGESHDHWEIRMRYHNPADANPDVCGDCVWETLVEGYDFSPSYPGVCVAGVRMLATDALSGAVPQVKARASRPFVCVWDGAEWLARPATNPAWCAYDIICQPLFPFDGREWLAEADGSMYSLEYGDEKAVSSFSSSTGGYTLVTSAAPHGLSAGDLVEFFNSTRFAEKTWTVASVPSSSTFTVARGYQSESATGQTFRKVVRTDCAYGPGDADCAVDPRCLDYAAFASWAAHCDDDGIAMSAYFDGTTSAADALQYVCDIGRAAIVRRGQVYAAVYDGLPDAVTMRGDPIPAYAFTDDNIEAGTFRVGYATRDNTPDEVQVFYFDRERENTRAAVIRFSGDRERHGRAQDVTLYCCDDRRVAAAYGDYVLRTSLVRRSFSWTGGASSMPLDIGDLVSVKGSLAVITAASCDSQMRRQFEATEYVMGRFVDSYSFAFRHMETGGVPRWQSSGLAFPGKPWPSDDPKTVLAAWAGLGSPCPRVDGEPWPDSGFWVRIVDDEGNVPEKLLPDTHYSVVYKYEEGLSIDATGYCRRPE